ncbi:hypothetical protein KP509_24G065200 [Ceratopteris richardii]|uniref:Phytocyanin domain-containing protein n=1 Tax=Ceratopteris richardii TaxID=49495 RepID=A0A8T2RVY8_CERRI|nr:hypothetical protein KP509_24G065200 [Ceratopteris richardii]
MAVLRRYVRSALSALLFLQFISSTVLSDDHIVGANHGWQVPAQSGVNLNYSNWAANQTFYLGDFISFHYEEGLHTVYEVNKTTYENCGVGSNGEDGKEQGDTGAGRSDLLTDKADDDVENANEDKRPIIRDDRNSSDMVLRDWSTKGGRSIVLLNESRNYYFVCGVGDHCQQGMKVAIHVLPTHRPTSQRVANSNTSDTTTLTQSSSSSSSNFFSCCSISFLIFQIFIFSSIFSISTP